MLILFQLVIPKSCSDWKCSGVDHMLSGLEINPAKVNHFHSHLFQGEIIQNHATTRIESALSELEKV